MLEKCRFRQQFRPEILRSKNRFRKLKQCEPLQLNSGLPFRLRMAGFYNAMHVINVISAYRLIDNFTASPLLSSHSQPLCAARSVSLAPTSIQRTLSPLHNCFEMHTLICLYLATSYYITHLQQVTHYHYALWGTSTSCGTSTLQIMQVRRRKLVQCAT